MKLIYNGNLAVKLDFHCSLRAAHLSAKYAAVRFYLDWFVSDNVEFCTSHTYMGDDWKQRRKVNQSMPKATLRGAYDEKEKKTAPNSVHLEGSNRGGSGAKPAALSVLCFVPCFYLHRIIYFPYIPRTNARYKAVRGAADISTQAGSLETFELLARRAGGVWGVVAAALSGVVQGCERETRSGFGGRDGDGGGGAASRG